MKITVIGLGHVGLTTAACLAHIGHEVVGTDSDVEKVRLIERGETPFFEPGLTEMLREGLDTGRLRVSETLAGHGEVMFICVSTPVRDNGQPNLVYVEAVARDLAGLMNGYTVVTEKSTVPVGTSEWIRRTIGRLAPGTEFDVASNPEFLREGQAVNDTLDPTRIVVGAPNDRSHRLLREVYQPIIDRTACPYIATDVPTAEIVKLASNAFLATKISFINAMADLCEASGADVRTVAEGMGLDPRIGRDFLNAGLGFGGYCLPKDLVVFRQRASELGVDFGLLTEVEKINRNRLDVIVGKVRELVWHLEGKRVGVLGLAFKGGTDDLRSSPALDLVSRLNEEGAEVVAYDPVAMDVPDGTLETIETAPDAYKAADGANVVILATDWDEFRALDLNRLREVMAEPIIVDGRNLLDPTAAANAGFTYASVGRRTLHPTGQTGVVGR